MQTVISTQELQRRIERLYDHLYANAAMKTPARIAHEVSKVLHAALYIEEVLGEVPAVRENGYRVNSLPSAAEAASLSGRLRAAYDDMQERWGLYPQKEKIALEDYDLAFVGAQLAGVQISSPDRDVLGDALEIFRSQWSKREGGQFFTDQQVTRLAMDLLEFDPSRGDDLVDICAGTGGFLLAAVEHVRSLIEGARPEAAEDEVIEATRSAVFGQEIDGEVADIANATLRSRLPGAQHNFVSTGDSLRSEFDSGRIRLGEHLCAATNPPFGTKITVKDPAILAGFELARRDPERASSVTVPRAPDILFLERNIRLLKPGRGRLAFVMPYQMLSGPQALFVRRWLLRNATLIAVVDLPADTFQPHTGTKAALVVLQRREQPLASPDEATSGIVFMSAPKWIGHDRRGNPVFRFDAAGNPTGELLTDIPEVGEAYLAFRAGTDPTAVHVDSISVPMDEVLQDPMLRFNARHHLHRKSLDASPEDRQGWSSARLGDVVQRVFCPGRFKRSYIPKRADAIPFLGGTNVTQLHIQTDKWMSPDDPRLEQLRVQEGWVLVTRSGSTGIVSTVPKAWDGYAISDHVIRIVPDPTRMSAGYLQLFLRSERGQAALAAGVFGSVIDEITPDHISDIEIPVPPQQTLDELSTLVDQSESARHEAIARMREAMRGIEVR